MITPPIHVVPGELRQQVDRMRHLDQHLGAIDERKRGWDESNRIESNQIKSNQIRHEAKIIKSKSRTERAGPTRGEILLFSAPPYFNPCCFFLSFGLLLSE